MLNEMLKSVFKSRCLRRTELMLGVLAIICLAVCSCSRIKSKGQKSIKKMEQKAKSEAKELIDLIFPFYDLYTADTKYNKKRFTEYVRVEITPDVKDIYCYADFLGIDYKIIFSFTCDSSTIQRIIDEKKLELSNDENDVGLDFREEIEWWDRPKIYKIRPFKQGEQYKNWYYLWFDKDAKKAYYLQYSL